MQELNMLYIVLMVGFAVLVIFASYALYRLIAVLNELDETLSRINKIAETVDNAVATVVPTVTGLSTILSGFSIYLRKLVGGTSSRKTTKK